MEYPSSGMTCYNKHQHLQSMNNDCNPLIQDQYNGPDQHLLYTINASQDNGSSSGELD
jgi:hypothetical protein